MFNSGGTVYMYLLRQVVLSVICCGVGLAWFSFVVLLQSWYCAVLLQVAELLVLMQLLHKVVLHLRLDYPVPTPPIAISASSFRQGCFELSSSCFRI